MVVCGRCFLCGSKLSCGGRVRCEDCAERPSDRPLIFECPRPECEEFRHKICAGCLDALHGLGGLNVHESAVLEAILARIRAGERL